MERTKTSIMIERLYSGDHAGALKLASTFRMLGEHRATIHRAWAALQNPGFYRQIGRDPEAAVSAGIASLTALYPNRA